MKIINLVRIKNVKFLFGTFVLFTLVLALQACHHEPLFEIYQKMKNATWDRFDQKYFEIPLQNRTKGIDITLVVRNTKQFGYDELPLYVILTTPGGEERVRELQVPIRRNGKMTGQPQGIVFETRMLLFKDLTLTDKGNCKISIESLVPKIQTQGIAEIGIVGTKTP